MKFKLGIFFLLISFFAKAENVQDLIYEKKFINLEYAFYQGSYTEVEAEALKLFNKKDFKNKHNRNYFQVLSLMARAQYLNSDFEKVNQTIDLLKKELEPLTDSLKINGLTALAELYIFINQP